MDLVGSSSLLELLLCAPYGGYLRVGVDDPRDGMIAHLFLATEDMVHRYHPFVGSCVGEHRDTIDISYGIDTWD